MARPTWNVQHERKAAEWAQRVDSETLAAMLSSGVTGSTYYLAAQAEWNRRFS